MPKLLRRKCFLSIALGVASVLCTAQTNTANAPPPVPFPSTAPASGSVNTAGTASAGATPSPTPLPDPLGHANALYRRGEFEAAIHKYQDLLRAHPKSPDAYAGMVRVYLKQKDVTRAVETITEAMKLSDAPRLHVALAETMFRQGRIPEAEKEWVNVINAGHPEARAYLGLARVRDAIGLHKAAKTLIDKAHLLDPHDPDIQEYWTRTLPRAERVHFYESYLAGENNLSEDERADLKSYLDYLKDRAKQTRNACRLVSNITKTKTPLVRLLFDPEHLRGYGLTVTLNGSKSKLMLDTGASGIVVNRGIAQRAGISKVTETKVWGIGDKGRRNAYIGIADSIKIGDLEFRDCPVEVMESRSVAGEDGLVGTDIFEDFLVDIDFPAEKLKLSELPKRPGESEQRLTLKSSEADADDQDSEDASSRDSSRHSGPQDRYLAPEMKSFSPIYRFGHDLLVPTRVGEVPVKLFLIDTGALTNAISPQAAREITKVHNDDTTVKGISGSVKKVYSANKAVLQFGHLRQENQDMLSFDTTAISDSAGTEISGFLGFVLLRFLDVKIDYRDDLVDFNYDPDRLRHF